MLGEVGLGHVVIDLPAFVRGDVGARIASFVDELLEKGVHVANDGLPV